MCKQDIGLSSLADHLSDQHNQRPHRTQFGTVETWRCSKANGDVSTPILIEEGGINGLVVRSVAAGGTIGRDGRIQPGDYMVRVNGENMRHIGHSQALDILRRTQASSILHVCSFHCRSTLGAYFYT